VTLVTTKVDAKLESPAIVLIPECAAIHRHAIGSARGRAGFPVDFRYPSGGFRSLPEPDHACLHAQISEWNEESR